MVRYSWLVPYGTDHTTVLTDRKTVPGLGAASTASIVLTASTVSTAMSFCLRPAVPSGCVLLPQMSSQTGFTRHGGPH